ncbi:hypothetical protein [Haloarcula onubensis]|nr:hypothetical protein [Halomicroarcula sp. S3CR25-11]
MRPTPSRWATGAETLVGSRPSARPVGGCRNDGGGGEETKP